MLAFKKNSPLKPAKTEPSFRKLNSLPTKLCMLFPAHLQARELCPQTYSLLLPLEWSQVTHIPASIKSGGTYKPERSAFYSTFATTTLTNIQAHSGKLCTHRLPTITFNELENLHSVFLFFLSVGGFLQSSAQPHESAARPLQRAAGHIKGTRPLVDFGCRHGKV